MLLPDELATLGRAALAARAALVALAVLASAPALAHDLPFSYLDLRIGGAALEARLTVHKADAAHELALVAEDTLLDPTYLAARAPELFAVLSPRLVLRAGGRALAPELAGAVVSPERQAIALLLRYPWASAPGAIRVRCGLFPYDPQHETFVNVYEGGALIQQEIFSRERREAVVFTRGRQGIQAVIARFARAGVHHIFIGPDHILFVVGLLMLGGGFARLTKIVTAFTVAHSVTLALATLRLLTPPARIIEPAIAFSIVCIGMDNLRAVRPARSARLPRRDLRAAIAFGFGFVHGFGFAGVLGELGLPRQALGWSLASFNLGVEVGQLTIVGVVAPLLALVRGRSPGLARRVVTLGSWAIVLAGGTWFVARVVALR